MDRITGRKSAKRHLQLPCRASDVTKYIINVCISLLTSCVGKQMEFWIE